MDDMLSSDVQDKLIKGICFEDFCVLYCELKYAQITSCQREQKWHTSLASTLWGIVDWVSGMRMSLLEYGNESIGV
jgi:hypothetical protein